MTATSEPWASTLTDAVVKWCVALATSLVAARLPVRRPSARSAADRYRGVIEQPGALAGHWISAGSTPPAVFVRLSIGWPLLARAAAGDWTAADQRRRTRRRSVPVLIAVAARCPAPSQHRDLGAAVRALAAHLRGRVIAYQIEYWPGNARVCPRSNWRPFN